MAVASWIRSTSLDRLVASAAARMTIDPGEDKALDVAVVR